MPDRFTAGTVTNSTEMGRPATRGFRGAHPTGVQTQTPEQGVHPHVRIWDHSQNLMGGKHHPVRNRDRSQPPPTTPRHERQRRRRAAPN